MKYKLVQKSNPSKPDAAKKWYANAVNTGTITLRTLSKDIAGRSSLTVGDVSNVIENLIERLPQYLVEGNSIKLGNLGTFRLSLSSEGIAKKEDFTGKQIKKAKVLFTPGTEIKNTLAQAKFEQE